MYKMPTPNTPIFYQPNIVFFSKPPTITVRYDPSEDEKGFIALHAPFTKSPLDAYRGARSPPRRVSLRSADSVRRVK
jgi:hypothetical protein